MHSAFGFDFEVKRRRTRLVLGWVTTSGADLRFGDGGGVQYVTHVGAVSDYRVPEARQARGGSGGMLPRKILKCILILLHSRVFWSTF